MSEVCKDFSYYPCDREMWDREFEAFVPRRIFDAHSHLWSEAHTTPYTLRDNDWRDNETSFDNLRRASCAIFPGRDIAHLTFAMPIRSATYVSLNDWVASELNGVPYARGAMLVVPEMSAEHISDTLARHETFIALKPYYLFAEKAKPGIADYLPEHQMEVANAKGLPVIVHLPSSVGDWLDDLLAFSGKYPRIKWVFAHCAILARSPNAEDVLVRLRGIPNLWYDTAVVCDSRIHELLLKREDHRRILFGTDNAIGIGGCRRLEREVAPGIGELKCYNQLRCQKTALENVGAPQSVVEDVFYNNAVRLFGYCH